MEGTGGAVLGRFGGGLDGFAGAGSTGTGPSGRVVSVPCQGAARRSSARRCDANQAATSGSPGKETRYGCRHHPVGRGAGGRPAAVALTAIPSGVKTGRPWLTSKAPAR